jgi:hypothetical protein
MTPVDLAIIATAGPEPKFDPVVSEFLRNSKAELFDRLVPGGLLEAVDLGQSVPWLWRLSFETRGLARDGAQIVPCDRHTVAVRFGPDYLRHVNRFDTLRLVAPETPFHPNLRTPYVCLEVYPGESLVEICESLHSLLSWRLRQLNEVDALDPEACQWGRANLDKLPTDDRPLFGRRLVLTLEPVEA